LRPDANALYFGPSDTDRPGKIAMWAIEYWSEHLDLVAHRTPKSNVGRLLLMAGRHRLLGWHGD
jgi:hypothetical protein